MNGADRAKTVLHGQILPALKANASYFPLAAVRFRLGELGVEIAEGSLRQYISEAMAKGVVHDAGRGWYSSISEPFKLDLKPVRVTIQRIQKAFPLLDFSCCSTQQINPYMHHILN